MKPDKAKLEAAGFSLVEIDDVGVKAIPPGAGHSLLLAYLNPDGDMMLFPERSALQRKVAAAHGMMA